MLATTGPLPHDDRWAVELKYDGVRAIVHCPEDPKGPLRLWSRNDRDLARSYPELATLELGRDVVVDAEIVALDSRGRPDFELLQRRLGHTAPRPELVAETPVTLVVFDLLVENGRRLLDLPYDQRREHLHALNLAGPSHLHVPPNWPGTGMQDLLTAAAAHGLEGVIAKRRASRYESGRRSRAWVKHPIRHSTDVVILGWSPASGRSQSLGSLHVAIGDGTRLIPAGEVGTGFSQTTSRHLLTRLIPLHRDTPAIPTAATLPSSPFARRRTPRPPVHWVEPILVGRVQYRQLTRAGQLRHASFVGLQDDRSPSDVALQQPFSPLGDNATG
ncbi:hypothetical protein H7X46_00220 [Pseudonocardia sp. C8]|nr:hypothetical protein [Pseudonocardia sp. C8]